MFNPGRHDMFKQLRDFQHVESLLLTQDQAEMVTVLHHRFVELALKSESLNMLQQAKKSGMPQMEAGRLPSSIGFLLQDKPSGQTVVILNAVLSYELPPVLGEYQEMLSSKLREDFELLQYQTACVYDDVESLNFTDRSKKLI